MNRAGHRSGAAIFVIRAAIIALAILTALGTWRNLARFPRTEDAGDPAGSLMRLPRESPFACGVGMSLTSQP
ncbi:MAG: hypothetical protein M0Q93_00620 [Terrimicrobiaceae bacterium]|nr:hypothetical protein [Terrimicrobiaceae bacterium]